MQKVLFLRVALFVVFCSLLYAEKENTLFFPSEEFQKGASIQSLDLFEKAKENKEDFWAEQAKCLHWFHPWKSVLDWQPPYAKWFQGGKLNACYNCLDRHVEAGIGKKIALLWEGENGDERAITYEELYREVNRFSTVLKGLGIQKGDRVALYLPMIPETVVAMLSCARIGAIHTVIFGGFSSEALRERIQDAEAKLVITADGGFRRGKIVSLKDAADQAVQCCPSVQHMIVVLRTNQPISMKEGRDHTYLDLMDKADSFCRPEEMDAEDPLFILYTSGTTGKPKGIVHSTGGYMVGATMTTRWVFDIKPTDIYWCTADVGWITGHSYIIYGPLSNAMTEVLYEGAPDWPQRDRWWRLIEKYKVSILYTAPTAVRTWMKWGEEWVQGHDLTSLRLLGSVGEPINSEAWMWYYTHIGHGKCPIVDTWWQTETGSIMIAPIPGITPLKAGSATKPLPGIDLAIVNDKGTNSSWGQLIITSPWPSMLRGIYKEAEKYETTYWKNGYETGDNAQVDQDGYYWLMGRADDVIKISGHRLSTGEIESVLHDFPGIAENAAVAIPHPIKGQALVIFVSLRDEVVSDSALAEVLKEQVGQKIGAIARPEKIIFINSLPKTRSGKIMRRLLRDIAEGHLLGDISTVSDPSVIDEIKKAYEET